MFNHGDIVQALVHDNGIGSNSIAIVEEAGGDLMVLKRLPHELNGARYRGSFLQNRWALALPQFSVGDYVKAKEGLGAPADLPPRVPFLVNSIEPNQHRPNSFLVGLLGTMFRCAPGRLVRCDENGEPLPPNPYVHEGVVPRGLADAILDPNAPIIPPGKMMKIETKAHYFGPDRIKCKIKRDKSFPDQRIEVYIEPQFVGVEECAALSVFFSCMAESLRP